MRIGVIGASGYVGGELIRILLHHPQVQITLVTSRKNKGDYIFRIHPNLRGVTDLRFSDYNIENVVNKCDIVFTSLPHRTSVKIVSECLDRGLKVIDLSADFRLKNPELYELWYHWKHPSPHLLSDAIYGLPELHKKEISEATLIANPGCMSTSTILALAPLMKTDFVDYQKIVVDSKIGSSAGGTSPTIFTHHAERYGVVRPYQTGHHRHIAEIEQELEICHGKKVIVAMTPHAVNMVRGILSTCHIFLVKSKVEMTDLWKIYRMFYKDCPFIRLIRDSQGLQRFPDPKFLIGSNFCDIGFDIDSHANRIVVFSAIDNLIKGAAGQAIQNMNLVMKIDERTGLEITALHPL